MSLDGVDQDDRLEVAMGQGVSLPSSIA